MNDQAAVPATIAAIFARWFTLTERLNGPESQSQAQQDFDATTVEVRALELSALDLPARSADDVWRKVVMMLDQPMYEARSQEAILARLGWKALGLPLRQLPF